VPDRELLCQLGTPVPAGSRFSVRTWGWEFPAFRTEEGFSVQRLKGFPVQSPIFFNVIPPKPRFRVISRYLHTIQ
jgi:hypothetical protein